MKHRLYKTWMSSLRRHIYVSEEPLQIEPDRYLICAADVEVKESNIDGNQQNETDM